MFRFENDLEKTISEEIQLYAEKEYTSDIIAIMLSKEVSSHISIAVDSMSLFESNIAFAHYMFQNPRRALKLLDNSFQKVSRNISKNHESRADMIYQENLHVRLIALPNLPEVYRSNLPSCSDVGQFLCISGTVVRASSSKMLQYKKEWRCGKCKYMFVVEAEVEQGYVCEKPLVCCNPEYCSGKNFTLMSSDINAEWCKDYQEIKLQEQVYNLNVGSVPKSMWVVLEDDLVESCHPGNDVIVSGVLIQQWKPLLKGNPIDITLVILAHNIEVQNKMSSGVVSKEMAKEFGQFWQDHRSDPLIGRNFILSSICPQVFGMYIIKLAAALVLAGGVQKQSGNCRIRGDSHLLLVGDPGTAKSQFLKYSTKVSARSVLTSGIGTTNAGLTVSAVKESGRWQLEAGALVLADGGICCIDEFSCIKEQDKTCIHEAMEQQTISVAKAGLVCSLNTRCSILAATNPKGKYDENMSISENTALGSPLLSRFDIILVLLDTYDETWDDLVSSYILDGRNIINENSNNKLWSVAKMKNYITLIRHINPKVSTEAERVLRAYYTRQRSLQAKHSSRTTPRLLQSLIRLAEGHARLMFRSEVLVIDAVIAVILVESSMLGNSILEGLSPLHTVFPSDVTAEYEEKAEKVFHSLNIDISVNKSYEYFYEESSINNLLSEISAVWGQKEDPFLFGSLSSDRSFNSNQFSDNSLEINKLHNFTDTFKIIDVPSKNVPLKDNSNQSFSPTEQDLMFEINRSNDDKDKNCVQSELNQISTHSSITNIFVNDMPNVISSKNDFNKCAGTSKNIYNLSPLDQILQEPDFNGGEHSNFKNTSKKCNMFNNPMYPALTRTTEVNEIAVTEEICFKESNKELSKTQTETSTTDIFEQLGLSSQKNIETSARNSASSPIETSSCILDNIISGSNMFPSKRSIADQLKTFAFSKSQGISNNIRSDRDKISNNESKTITNPTSDSEHVRKYLCVEKSQSQSVDKKDIFNMIKNRSKNSSNLTLENNGLVQNIHESSTMSQNNHYFRAETKNNQITETKANSESSLDNHENGQNHWPFTGEEQTSKLFENTTESQVLCRKGPTISDKLKKFVFSKASVSNTKNSIACAEKEKK